MADTDTKIGRTNAPDASLDALAQASVVRRRVMRLANRLRTARAREGVSLTKLSLLGYLQSRVALTAGALAARHGARPQSLTRVLAEMETEGLISRAQDPADRRRSLIQITPAGRQALAGDMRQRDVWLATA